MKHDQKDLEYNKNQNESHENEDLLKNLTGPAIERNTGDHFMKELDAFEKNISNTTDRWYSATSYPNLEGFLAPNSSPEVLIRKDNSTSVSISELNKYQQQILDDVIHSNREGRYDGASESAQTKLFRPAQQRHDSDLSMTEIAECIQALTENPNSNKSVNNNNSKEFLEENFDRREDAKKIRPVSYPIGRQGNDSILNRNVFFEHLSYPTTRGVADGPDFPLEGSLYDHDGLNYKSKSSFLDPDTQSYTQSYAQPDNIEIQHRSPIKSNNTSSDYPEEKFESIYTGLYSNPVSSKSFGVLGQIDDEKSRPRSSLSGRQSGVSGYEYGEDHGDREAGHGRVPEFSPYSSPYGNSKKEPSSLHLSDGSHRSKVIGFQSNNDDRQITNSTNFGYYNDLNGSFEPSFDRSGTQSRPHSASFSRSQMRPDIAEDYDSKINHRPVSANFSSIENLSPIVSGYDGYVYKVQFKRSHRNFLRSAGMDKPIRTGDFVIVEADRGEDLGVVCEVQRIPDFFREGGTLFSKENNKVSSWGDKRTGIKHILRHSLPQEYSLLPVKLAEEQSIIETCREQCRMYLLPMLVIDAEYQFDRHKLTIYYESSSRRIDFRELVRDLFAMYKTRIWMEIINYGFRPSEAAIRALATGIPMIIPHISAATHASTILPQSPANQSNISVIATGSYGVPALVNISPTGVSQTASLSMLNAKMTPGSVFSFSNEIPNISNNNANSSITNQYEQNNPNRVTAGGSYREIQSDNQNYPAHHNSLIQQQQTQQLQHQQALLRQRQQQERMSRGPIGTYSGYTTPITSPSNAIASNSLGNGFKFFQTNTVTVPQMYINPQYSSEGMISNQQTINNQSVSNSTSNQEYADSESKFWQQQQPKN